jgi:hypothetical protein
MGLIPHLRLYSSFPDALAGITLYLLLRFVFHVSSNRNKFSDFFTFYAHTSFHAASVGKSVEPFSRRGRFPDGLCVERGVG